MSRMLIGMLLVCLLVSVERCLYFDYSSMFEAANVQISDVVFDFKVLLIACLNIFNSQIIHTVNQSILLLLFLAYFLKKSPYFFRLLFCFKRFFAVRS